MFSIDFLLEYLVEHCMSNLIIFPYEKRVKMKVAAVMGGSTLSNTQVLI